MQRAGPMLAGAHLVFSIQHLKSYDEFVVGMNSPLFSMADLVTRHGSAAVLASNTLGGEGQG